MIHPHAIIVAGAMPRVAAPASKVSDAAVDSPVSGRPSGTEVPVASISETMTVEFVEARNTNVEMVPTTRAINPQTAPAYLVRGAEVRLDRSQTKATPPIKPPIQSMWRTVKPRVWRRWGMLTPSLLPSRRGTSGSWRSPPESKVGWRGRRARGSPVILRRPDRADHRPCRAGHRPCPGPV